MRQRSLALAEAVDAAGDNLVLHMTWVQARAPGMIASVDAALALADAGLGRDTFNTVCRARLRPEDEDRVTDAIQHFTRRGQPFSWWLGPGDTPGDLDSVLERAGLVFAEAETAMVADLSDMAEVLRAPADLRIERVRSLGALKAFAEVNAANWSPPDPAVLAFYERGAQVLQEQDCPLQLYVAYIDTQAVATAEVVVSGRIAGLYNVATQAGYRRQGIGMTMTFTALAEARREGAALGVLQASDEGVGVYEKVGFSAFGEYREFKPPLAGQ